MLYRYAIQHIYMVEYVSAVGTERISNNGCQFDGISIHTYILCILKRMD